MGVNTTSFLSDVKQLITLPSNPSRITDANILSFANRKMKDSLVPVIHSLNEEFWLTRTEVEIVAGQTQYEIPRRAMGRKFRDVKLMNDSGQRVSLPQVSIEREQYYRQASTPAGFFMYGDRLELVPEPQATGYSLHLWWFLPPGDLVPVSDAGLVTGISGDDVTVAVLPSTLATGVSCDFVQGYSGNSYLGYDQAIQSIAGTTLTFDTDAVPTDLQVGDYVTVSNTSPILQIPDVGVPYLVTLTAMEILQAISDYDGMDKLKETRDDQKKNLMLTLTPRVEGEVIPLVNDYGFLGGPRRGIWSGWGLY